LTAALYLDDTAGTTSRLKRVQLEQRSSTFSFWSLPQPVFVFGCTILAASAMTTHWMDAELLVPLMIFGPILLFTVLERLIPRRRDWLLNWRDLAEDTFWGYRQFAASDDFPGL
jgi:hypothetical protein